MFLIRVRVVVLGSLSSRAFVLLGTKFVTGFFHAWQIINVNKIHLITNAPKIKAFIASYFETTSDTNNTIISKTKAKQNKEIKSCHAELELVSVQQQQQKQQLDVVVVVCEALRQG